MSKQRIINMLVCGVGLSVLGGICYAVLADHPVQTNPEVDEVDESTRQDQEIPPEMDKRCIIPSSNSLKDILTHYRTLKDSRGRADVITKLKFDGPAINDMSCDAEAIVYDRIEVPRKYHSICGLFTTEKINKSTIPGDLYVYEVADLSDTSDILTILLKAPDGMCYGTAIFTEPIGIGETSDHSFGVVINRSCISAEALPLYSLLPVEDDAGDESDN